MVMMCDFNANVGQSDSPESSAIGPHGIGERNERGDRLVDFATANEMVISNTLFKQHRRRLYTWTSPDGNTINQIDYFCIHERWKTTVVNTKTLPGADYGSNHELLMMSMRLKIKKTKAAKHPIRYDMIHIPEQFNVDIKNRYAGLIPIVDEMTPNELWEKIKITTAKVAKETLSRKRSRKKQWISEETLDLIDERRNMKAQGKNVNNPEYKEKSRVIRRACRKDKERYTEDKRDIIAGLCKQGRTSEMYKEIRTLIKKFTPKLNVIKDENGETLTENDDILARWKEHCEGLFAKYDSTDTRTTECDDNEQGNSSEKTDEDDEELIPLRSEVELAVKQLKNGKSTGCDDISTEMNKASGELGISLLHRLIVNIWQT